MPQKKKKKMLEMSLLSTEGACGHVSNSLPKLQEENWNPVGWNLPAVRGKKKETGGQTDRDRHRDTERERHRKRSGGPDTDGIPLAGNCPQLSKQPQ